MAGPNDQQEYGQESWGEDLTGLANLSGLPQLFEAMNRVAPDLPPPVYLYEIGQAYIRFALEHPDYFLMMFTVAPPVAAGLISPEPPAEAPPEPNAYNLLVQAIQRGLDSGAFQMRPGFGPTEMTYAAWTLVHGIAMLRITALRDYPADLDHGDHEALQNFMRGLQAP